MAKKKKDKNLLNWSEMIVWCYLAVMLGIFPLYYQNRYWNIGAAKYRFFRLMTLIMLIYLAVTQICKCLFDSKKEKFQMKLSRMDRVVLLYMIAAVVSWTLSPWRTDAWIGSEGWYMGLLSQLMFAGIYFALSRFGTVSEWLLWVIGVSGAIVFIFAYIHRFNLDPLGLYEGVAEDEKIGFLGFLGNATWYSSYLCVILPVMAGVYIMCDWSKVKNGPLFREWLSVFLFLGFCGVVTQNSDSVYVGMGLAFLFLLWFAMEDLQCWKKFVETGLIVIAAAKFTGILQIVFPEKARELGPLSNMITKSSAGWLILSLGFICYGITCWVQRHCVDRQVSECSQIIRRFRTFFYLLVIAGICSLPLMIWLVTTGELSGNFGALQESGYLVFDQRWGSGRGKIWSYAIRVFLEYPPVMKLFGCGPDALMFYTAAHHAEEAQLLWKDLLITNAHNEWLNAVVNYGIVGGAAYAGIFLTSLIRSVRNGKNHPLLPAMGAAVIAYMGHNITCYQQSVCTPLIFMVMGTAEYLIRRQGGQSDN